MKDFVKNLAALIKVKTIVTLAIIIVFTVLALRGDIAPDNVMVIVSTVIAFYFGTQHEKHNTSTEQITDHSLCPFMNQGSGETESTEALDTVEKDGE